jgi:hypothetical protein
MTATFLVEEADSVQPICDGAMFSYLFVWPSRRTHDTTSRLHVPCTKYRVLIDQAPGKGVMLGTVPSHHLQLAYRQTAGYDALRSGVRQTTGFLTLKDTAT